MPGKIPSNYSYRVGLEKKANSSTDISARKTTRGAEYFSDFFFHWAYITGIMSMVFSIPTIIVLYYINRKLLLENATKIKIQRKLLGAQVICGSSTFAFLIVGFSFDAWDYLLCCAAAFISTGVFIWNLEIKKAGL
jgi:hypothetical protein